MMHLIFWNGNFLSLVLKNLTDLKSFIKKEYLFVLLSVKHKRKIVNVIALYLFYSNQMKHLFTEI